MNHFTFFAALLVLGVGCASTPKPLPTSIPPLKALAEKGDAEAQFQLAHKYYLGKGVEKDYKKAVIWYRKAAEQNFPQAQFTLGYQYILGQGVEKSEKEAVKWFLKAAAQNEPYAQHNLGVMYDSGRGVEKDYKEAVKWYRKAAEQNSALTQSALGVMYREGKGVEQDNKEAVKWFRKAAEQNEPHAQSNLGVMYDSGRGVEKDYREAVKWYRKAAEQNEPYAQHNLGVMYDSGRGVEKDYREAVKWYRKAAEQNFPQAQARLGFMHIVGRGVEKNGKEATKWYRKAADQGNESAKDILKRIPEHVISEQMLISEQLPKRRGYTHLAWNLAYNFSSEEKDTNERWKWVNAGISLLRDEAIPKYPDEPELYWELAWTFMHKMGQGSDAAHRNYKNIWINQMTDVLWPSLEDCQKSGGRPNFKELINPPRDDSKKSRAIRAHVERLTREFKMDPLTMQQIDRELGTMMVPDEKGKFQPKYVGLEWRLPETHSIYWSWVGSRKCQHNIPRLDIVRKLRRVMFQSMMINCQRGRLVVDRSLPDWEDRYRGGENWVLFPRLESIGVGEKMFRKQLEWIKTILANQKQKSKELTKRIKELERELDEKAMRPKPSNDEKKSGVPFPNEATLEKFRQRNYKFYRKAVTDLYMYNQVNQARYYLKLLYQEYPEQMLFHIGYDVKTKTMDLDTFVTEQVVQEIEGGSRVAVGPIAADPKDVTASTVGRSALKTAVGSAKILVSPLDSDRQGVIAILHQMISVAYRSLIMGEDDQARGRVRLAQRTWERYNRRKIVTEENRVLLPPFLQIHDTALQGLLQRLSKDQPLKAANLRQRLGLKDGAEAKFNALPDAINPFKKNKPNKK